MPAIRVDTHLPAPAPASLMAQALVQRFAAGANGRQHSAASVQEEAGPGPVPASVLVPLVQREQLTVLLTQRTAQMRKHSGQIAFPGGKADAQDRDAEATALREAQEEVGLEPDFVQLIGRLPVYPMGTGFIVTPVVALVRPGFSIVPNAHEVADVFEVPLAYLMDPGNHHHHEVQWEGRMRNWLSIPYRDGAVERYIWGATAGILRSLYSVLID